MGKYHTTEFKLQALQPILNGKMSIREATGFYSIPSNAYVAMEHFGATKNGNVYSKEFKTKEKIVEAVKDYLDYYNHRRIQLKLKIIENSPLRNRLTF